MEKAKFAFAHNTGMGATLSVLGMLKQGDHLLCIDDVYGGTQRYLRRIFTPNYDIDWTMADMSDMKKVRAAM
jgi:cystathionine beta-lyase/cystathionine gamma-synthase